MGWTDNEWDSDPLSTGGTGGIIPEEDGDSGWTPPIKPPPVTTDPKPDPVLPDPENPENPPEEEQPPIVKPDPEDGDTEVITPTPTEDGDPPKKPTPGGPVFVDEEPLPEPVLTDTVETEGDDTADDPNSDKPLSIDELGDWYNNNFTDETIMPNVNTKEKWLESVSVYKSIDLISEGPIAGFVDTNGNLIELTNDLYNNEDGFKGIYFNNVAVKNTNANNLNFNRVFSEVKYGTADQGLLVHSSNVALSLQSSSQTFIAGQRLAGMAEPGFPVGSRRRILQSNATTGGGENILKPYPTIYKNYGSLNGQAAAEYLIRSNSPSFYGVLSSATAPREITWATEVLKDKFERHPVKYQHTITNDNVTDVEIGLQVDQLFENYNDDDDGLQQHKYNINFALKIGYVDDDRLLGDGGSVVYILAPIYGRASSQYIRSYNFKLPSAIKGRDRQVTVINLSFELRPSWTAYTKGGRGRQGGVNYLTEIVNRKLSYPHSCIVGSIIDARAFAQIPKRTYDMKLVKIKVPENYDPESRSYRGNWTGRFALDRQWSNNPAWVFYDLITNKRYGLGRYGFGESIVDKWNIYSIAKYCDELVETGYRTSYEPCDYTINRVGNYMEIDDSQKRRGKAWFTDAGFTNNATVAIYNNKNEDGEDVNLQFLRRITACEYISTAGSEKFRFRIHRVVSPDFAFNYYVTEVGPNSPVRKWWLKDLYESEVAEAEKEQRVKPTKMSWALNYLATNKEDDNSFVNDYNAVFPLGSGIVEGKVGVQSYGSKKILEPRFTTNIYLDKEQEAYNALNDLAAVFRGMLYWNNGFIFLSNDQAREAVLVFNNSNVKDGVFTYSGSPKTSRYTSVLVRYNDESDTFKPKVEYVEDSAGLKRFGHMERKVIALGCTSRSQAHRLGKWFLFTNQTETDMVQFTAGVEATYLRPGDVVKLQDKLKTAKRYGGRLTAVDHAGFTVTLDQGIQEDIVGQKITFIVPRATKSVKDLNATAIEKVKEGDFSGVSADSINQTRDSQIKQYTIASVSTNNSGKEGGNSNVITISETTDEEFDRVQLGTIWSVQNTNSDFNIKEVEYRVTSVSEQSQGEYQVTGLLYNRSKFNAIDLAKDLTPSQQSEPQVTILVDNDRPEPLDPDTSATSATFLYNNLQSLYFDYEFTSTRTERDVALRVDFSNAAESSGVNKVNTGGFIIEISMDGDNRQITLYGADNTEFQVFLGPRDSYESISYSVYRFNTSFVLQETGNPDE